jgi:site-specific DNA-methyltransferase (adenine-specific)
MTSEALNIDCMDYMVRFGDRFFDLAVVDPPYGIGADRLGYGQDTKARREFVEIKEKHWDKLPPPPEYFKELMRVSKNQIIWGGNYFSDRLPGSMGWIFWDKGTAPGFTKSAGELAWTSFGRRLEKFSYIWDGAHRSGEIGVKRIHPTQKPIALYKWILQRYAKPGDKILDTHLGSGSSRIAAFDLGFDFYSTELDKDYFDAQEERFNDYKAQALLFSPEELRGGGSHG